MRIARCPSPAVSGKRSSDSEITTVMEVRGGRSALDEMSGTIEPSFEAPTRPLRTRFEPASAAQASARLTSPITAPGFAPIPVGRSPAVLIVPTPPAAFERPVLPPIPSRVTDVLGLALAWIATAGAAAVIGGFMIARSQPPLILRAPSAAAAIVAPSPLAGGPTCPRSWPPLVAVNDLPVAPPPSALHAAVVTTSARVPPVTEQADVHPSPAKAWASWKRGAAPGMNASASMKRRAHASETSRPSAATKGKTAPKSLADWMHAEVDSK
jgi:hypothetical protein